MPKVEYFYDQPSEGKISIKKLFNTIVITIPFEGEEEADCVLTEMAELLKAGGGIVIKAGEVKSL